MSKASPSVETPADDDPDAFPRPFGSYLLLQRFARGGMGEVFLGKFGAIAGLERYCVLKKLRAELTRDREYVTRFIDEARVVVTLNHANICHVFDVGRVGDEYYLAMEYISGRDIRTLQDRCRQRERTLPAATSLHIVCEVLEALDYAHRRNHPISGEPLNLVHRDVSPQNVLVSFEGEVKLIDFGLAASKLKVERTQPNVVMGKMAYMAPEQARGDPIDSRADLFACGVLAYELLAGERFYEGMSANDIWQVAGRGSFVPPKWPALDPDIAKILAKALHPDAKKRFATCGDFREALASHLHWRFPGTGVRGVRDVINELFTEEVRKERDLMSRYGRVTVASFRTTFENTQSQSVSLAHAADDEASRANSTRLTRDERTGSTPDGPMPPPRARDVHHEPTRLTTDPKKLLAYEETAASRPSGPLTVELSEAAALSSALRAAPSTLEASPVEADSSSSPREAEPTELVRRPASVERSHPRPKVKNLDLEAVTASAAPKRSPLLVLAGLVALVAAGAVGVVLTDPFADPAEAATSSSHAPMVPAPSEPTPPPAPLAVASPSPSTDTAAVLPPPAPEAAPPADSPSSPPPAELVAAPPAPPALPAADRATAAAIIATPATDALPAAALDPPMETLKAEPDRPRPRVTPPRRSTERADKAAERAREERQRQEAQADEERRKKDEADRKRAEAEHKKAEPGPPKNLEEAGKQCGAGCSAALQNFLGNKGSKAHELALWECLRRKRCATP